MGLNYYFGRATTTKAHQETVQCIWMCAENGGAVVGEKCERAHKLAIRKLGGGAGVRNV